jgi:hypothetical protein
VFGHRFVNGIDFAGFLYEGAAAAEPDQTAVVKARTIDVALLSDYATQLRQADDVGNRKDSHTTVETARFADLLSGLAGDVTRREVGDDAQGAVLETAAQPVLPFASSSSSSSSGWHCCRMRCGLPK